MPDKLFDRPIDFSYNADLNTLQVGICQLMDKVESQAEEIAELKKAKAAPAKKAVAKKPVAKKAPVKKPEAKAKADAKK